MSFSLTDMRSQLTYGGARNALFKVFISNPIDALADLKVPFMVKAADIPASNMGVVDVPYAGRVIKVKGDRTFEDWTVTVINDEDFLVRNAMEKWSNAMNGHRSNAMTTGSSSPSTYKAQGQIIQYSQTMQPIREYTFDGLFPLTIASIPMAWESANQIEEFQVTFAYDLWETTGGTTGISTS